MLKMLEMCLNCAYSESMNFKYCAAKVAVTIIESNMCCSYRC